MSDKMTKADLEQRVAEQDERIAELEAQLAQYETAPAQPEQSGPRDVAEIAAELRGES